MANNLMICSNAKNSLHLNESENTGQKYVLEGTFAELDKLNRNQRIYTKAEYLKHLAYLRNDIKSGEPLLGELDHPDDRFEVKLKEASHRIIDLWYDESDNTVKGKIELLDTPNGKLAKSIVDQGIPLHISSRAAGSVNQDNTVSIQQIYTYDLVCKPGFAGAVLHRVNESADAPKYSNDVKNFLTASLKAESMNAAPQYGFVNEDMNVSEIKAPATLRPEAKNIQINNQIEVNEKDMSKPLLENTNPDATVGKPLDISGNGAKALGIPTADDLQQTEGNDDPEKKDDDEEKKDVSDTAPESNDKPADGENKDNKLNSDSNEKKETSEDEGGDASEDDKEKKPETAQKLNDDEDEPEPKDDDNKDEESDDKKEGEDGEGEGDGDSEGESDGVKIIEVEAEFDEEGKDDMIKDVEPDFDDDDEKKGDEDGEGEPAEKEEGEPEADPEDSKEEAERTVEVGDDDEKDAEEEKKNAEEAEKLADEASEDIEKRKDTIMDKLDKLMDTIEKKNSDKQESKNESIIMAMYPVSMKMNESNFKEFAKLDEAQKSKVTAYLHDNGIYDSQSINESWKKGIDYVNETPVWLKYAPENYKALYEAASPAVRESINNTAKYVLFENQYDINLFWENSGLQEREERRLLNESFVNNLPKVAPQTVETNLPYSADYIKMITDMACEYNRKY